VLHSLELPGAGGPNDWRIERPCGQDSAYAPTFSDEATDVWGVVSAGVNFFNPGAQTSVFAKVDVSFGDDLDGIGGKAGMRYNW